MLDIEKFSKVLKKIEEYGYLEEFLELTFNYKVIDIKRLQYYIQKKEDGIILYIYEKREDNSCVIYEFINDYMDKYIDTRKINRIIINKVSISKCNTINKNINLVLFIKAFSNNDFKLLDKYLPKYMTSIIK